MADPILISVIRTHLADGYNGAITYRSGSGTAASGSKSLLREYDEAILDAKLQIIAQCASFVATEGDTFSDREKLARGLRADMEKYL